MKNKKILKIKKKAMYISLLVATLLSLALFQITKSELIENVTELEVNVDSELKYTITVNYDGKDRNGNISSNSDIIKLTSDYIYVEDKLPDGLIFQKFDVSGSVNQAVGAVPRDDSEQVCEGYVVNDSSTFDDPNSNHGLHYDPVTRKVSFKIKNLQAGCKINVVIVTKTPASIEGNRKDFYNTASALEQTQLVYSNMTHAYIQKEEPTESKTVTYRYDGDVIPPNASVPPSAKYVKDYSVSIADNPTAEGYKFLGWTIMSPLGLTITGGKFTMPDQDVVIVGRWEELPKHKVEYKIDGDMPNGYVLPTTKTYNETALVKLDSMNIGDTFNGYRFLGWTSEDVDISSDKDFQMPDSDVVIVGKWEKIKYRVTYEFNEGVRPPNYQEILDDLNSKDNTYYPNDKVTLPNVNDIESTETTTGYHFQGWYESDGFEMPEHDVVIYGEWMIRNGVFAPEIKKEINNPKDYYFPGDIVNYTITVTNTADYPIKNVIVRDNNEKATLNYISICNQGVLSGLDKGEENINEETKCNIESRSDHIVQINNIDANSSATIAASYLVTDEDFGIINNEVEILGATADNNYVLDQEREYKSEVSFKVASQINICKKVDRKAIEKEFQFRITNEDESFESWMILNSGECDTIYVEPGDYKVQEVIPQEFILSDSTRNKDGNEDSNYPNGELFVVDELSRYNFTFTNTYKKKGFLHSYGRVVNSILGSQDSLSLLG